MEKEFCLEKFVEISQSTSHPFILFQEIYKNIQIEVTGELSQLKFLFETSSKYWK